jgi:hypothetical protein
VRLEQERTIGEVRSGGEAMGAYWLFRRKGCEALCCAVPEEIVVPGFLNGANWILVGRFETGITPALAGFDEASAKLVASVSGFYLFEEALARSPLSQKASD